MMDTSNLSAADLAAIVGNNGDNFSGNTGWLWMFILLIFANGGWGNGWGNNGANGMIPYMTGLATQSDIQTGFDQAAIMSSLNGINSTVANGFANAEISRANSLAAITGQMNNIGMIQQQGNFDNRLAVANLGAQIASEACADRQAVNDGVRDILDSNNYNVNAILNTINNGIQTITDKLCQQEIDALKSQNENLRTQINLQSLAASQASQTAQLMQDNNAQTQALLNRLSPSPVPAYQVAPPFGYYNNCGCNGCGCN